MISNLPRSPSRAMAYVAALVALRGGVGRHPVRLAILLPVLLLAGCVGAQIRPSEGEVVGSWCADSGDVLAFSADGNFRIDHLSQTYANDILREDGYIDGYRLREEFGGVVPESAAGRWELQLTGGDLLDHHGTGVYLNFSKIGDRVSDDVLEMYFDRLDGELALAVFRDGPPRYELLFTKCSEGHNRQSGAPGGAPDWR